MREIATLQIALTVLKRPMGSSEVGPEEQAGARDRVRTKMKSWAVTRSLDMIAPEVSHKFSSLSSAPRLQHGALYTAGKKVEGLEDVGSG